MDQSQEWFRLTGNVLLIWAALVGTASVIAHLRVFNRRSQMSMHLLCYMLAMAIVLDLGVFRVFFGDSSWFQLVRLVAFIAVPLAMTQRLWMQIVAQHDARSGGDGPPADKSDRSDDREA